MAVVFADGVVELGCRQQLVGDVDREFVGGECFGHRGRLVAAAHIGAVLAGAQDDLFARLGMWADRERIQRCRVDVFDVVHHEWLQARQFLAIAVVKLGQPFVAHAFAFGDFVQLFFNRGGELVVNERGEVILEEAHNGERRP